VHFEIKRITEWRDNLQEDISTLLPELTSSDQRPSAADIKAIIESPATTLLVGIVETRMVGMLTLVVVRIPTGIRAHIEDVVVLSEYQRSGLGRALGLAAIERAREAGARTIDLTSRPERAAAIRLYERLGFQRRQTGVFRLSFEKEKAATGRPAEPVLKPPIVKSG
jgi:ribosomal protein S18 acetylase RimI-like enzyme